MTTDHLTKIVENLQVASDLNAILGVAFGLLLLLGAFAVWRVVLYKPKKPLPTTVAELRAQARTEVEARHEAVGEDVCARILARRQAERRARLSEAREKGHHYDPYGNAKTDKDEEL